MRRFLFLFTALVLAAALTGSALAFEKSPHTYVWDQADILTDSEEEALEALARQVSEKHQVGVYICAVWDYWSYGSQVYKAAENIYTDNGLGYGAGHDGAMLMLSMDERDFHTLGHGSGVEIFNDYALESMEDDFLDNFRVDDWYGGFADYIGSCDAILTRWEAGNPVRHTVWDTVKEFYNPLTLTVGLVLAFVVSWLIASGVKASMNTAVEQAAARQYVSPNGGVRLRVQDDRYTHTTTIRHKIETGGGGGHSHSSHSSGFSGRSGKF